MIKVEELRIGNLVMINEKVITMDARIFHAVIHGFEGYEPEPILLDDNWVTKLGFSFDIINDGDSPVWQINGYDFYLDDKYQPSDCGFNMVSFDVKYVHELQNVYRWIKGEELTIKETM